MPTSHTVTTIYNSALDIISERPSTGILDTGRAEVRWLNRNYAAYVQTALRKDLWNFAMELRSVARTTDPAFRWSYSYGALPNGWLRVVPLTYEGKINGTPIPFEVRSGSIITDYLAGTAGLSVELIMDRQTPGDWDPLFAAALIANLALGMAHSLTHKNSYVDRAKQLADEAYDVAAMVNGFEGTLAPVEQHDIIRARYR